MMRVVPVQTLGLLCSLLCGSLVAQTGTALVRHAPTLNGPVEGSIHQMTAENATLNGSAHVSGDLLVPGLPEIRLNGNPVYGGTVDANGAATPTSHKVTLNGGAALRHVVRRTDAVSLPVVSSPPAPTGTRSVSLNNSGQSPGDFTTLRNLTLNGNAGVIAVPPGAYGNFTANGSSGFILGLAGSATPAIYNFQSLTLNGNSSFQVAGPVMVTVANGFSTNSSMGSSPHPEWLKLRIAGGGLTINGSNSVHASIEAPLGAVTINGSGRLIGTLASDRLTINGNALLRLVAPAVTNQPPVVALTAPADGAAFTAPASFTLTATASDPDGTVAKVEFFNGALKLGEDTAAPYEQPVTALVVGSHMFTARATDNSGATATSPQITVLVSQPVSFALPFLTGFEAAEGYTLGPLHGQQGWTASSPAVVTDADFASGARSALVPDGEPPLSLGRVFDDHPDHAVVFVDFFTLLQAGDTEADSPGMALGGSARVALLREEDRGRFMVFAGNGAGGGAWEPALHTIPLDAEGYTTDWVRLTVRADYAAKRWDLYVNGVLTAADLGFAQNSQAGLGSFTLTGATRPAPAAGATLFDAFLGSFDNPLFADADKDGMDDAWETAHGLNPALNDRNGDLDADGLTNVTEYLLGTKPNNRDTDGDGLPDGWEWRHGLNPASAADAASDLDGDGVSNLVEYLQGRDPTKGAVPDPIGTSGYPDGAVNLRVYRPVLQR